MTNSEMRLREIKKLVNIAMPEGDQRFLTKEEQKSFATLRAQVTERFTGESYQKTSVNQGNESQVQVIIKNSDGDIVFNVHRTVRNITSDGITKKGRALVNGKVFLLTDDGSVWQGKIFDYI